MLALTLGLILATAPAVRQPADTAPVAAAAPGASSAPADSAAALPWYRRAPLIDARLMPTTTLLQARDTVRKRRKAVEYSDWYYRRLQIHRWGSYAELPLFAAEYWLGNKLMPRGEPVSDWVRPTHGAVAGALGVLFGVNTITGVWNLYDSRNDTDQRGLVWTHSALMLAADAGFAITGALAGDANEGSNRANQHRAAALTSIGLATLGTGIMWVARGF